ncbi:E3 ubiquitin-protein ligase TRIM71-like [Lytechinus pictus]|uniref:E3 ubiquitin-protein ligase TRIM71-like n=1 Tax=Lytechinus pictus TaxID=7653 RepID=UPI0030B9C272
MASAPSPTIEGRFQKCLKPGLNRPHDVIFHQGQYIVTDTFHNRVIAVNPADNSLEVLCEKKQERLSSNMRPYGIVALSDSKQDFLITDAANRSILRYTDNSCKVWSEAELPQNGCPAGIAVDASSGNAYVADSQNRCIRVYDADGRYCRSFGSDHLQSPWFLDFNSEGHIFVTDNLAGLKIFAKDGKFVKKLAIRSENRSWSCRGVTIDQYDNIFVTARAKGSFRLLSREKVVVFDHTHRVVSSLGGLMQFNYVRGLCCDYGNNRLVVVDGEWHRLQLYKLYNKKQSALRQHSVLVDSPRDEGDQALKEHGGDCDDEMDEGFVIVSSCDCQADIDDGDVDDPETRMDDYDYDYSHLELFREENYNIASLNLQPESVE